MVALCFQAVKKYLYIVLNQLFVVVEQVFVNFAKQQTGEDEDITLHRRTTGGRKDIKVSPVQRKT